MQGSVTLNLTLLGQRGDESFRDLHPHTAGQPSVALMTPDQLRRRSAPTAFRCRSTAV